MKFWLFFSLGCHEVVIHTFRQHLVKSKFIMCDCTNFHLPTQKLEKEGEIFCITRPDKEEVLFYKNHEYEVEVDEEFKARWHRVSVEGRTETDIEQYLENVGLGVMQGETRKRKAPGSQPGKPRKKARAQKVLNTHLDSDLLKDYSEGAPTKKWHTKWFIGTSSTVYPSLFWCSTIHCAPPSPATSLPGKSNSLVLRLTFSSSSFLSNEKWPSNISNLMFAWH